VTLLTHNKTAGQSYIIDQSIWSHLTLAKIFLWGVQDPPARFINNGGFVFFAWYVFIAPYVRIARNVGKYKVMQGCLDTRHPYVQ
jgi:hypothetical protein